MGSPRSSRRKVRDSHLLIPSPMEFPLAHVRSRRGPAGSALDKCSSLPPIQTLTNDCSSRSGIFRVLYLAVIRLKSKGCECAA